MTIEEDDASTPRTLGSSSRAPPSQLGAEEQEGKADSDTFRSSQQTQQRPGKSQPRGRNGDPDYADPSSHSVWHTGYPIPPSRFVQRATQFCEISGPSGRPMLM